MVVKIVFNIADCDIPSGFYHIARRFVGYPECEGYRSVSEARIHVDKIIICTENHTTYRGRFEYGYEGQITLKFGDMEKLRFETETYNLMENIWGTDVPHFLSLLDVKKIMAGGSEETGCLITEYFGESLTPGLIDLERPQKFVLSRLSFRHFLFDTSGQKYPRN